MPQAKIDNFAFKNSNIIIELYHLKKEMLFYKKKNLKDRILFFPELFFLLLRVKFLKLIRF